MNNSKPTDSPTNPDIDISINNEPVIEEEASSYRNIVSSLLYLAEERRPCFSLLQVHWAPFFGKQRNTIILRRREIEIYERVNETCYQFSLQESHLNWVRMSTSPGELYLEHEEKATRGNQKILGLHILISQYHARRTYLSLTLNRSTFHYQMPATF